MKKLKILVIPHAFSEKIKIREIEIAKHMANYKKFKIYCLKFGTDEVIPNTFKNKIIFQLKSLFKKIKTEEKNHIVYISIPYLFKPYFLSRVFNTFILFYIIKKNNINIILNSSIGKFNLNNLNNVIKIYDLVDSIEDKKLRRIVLNDLRYYDYVFTINNMLLKKINKINKNITVVENGTDILKFKKINKIKINKIKKKLKIKNSIPIVFIGNHYPWSGTHFLISVVKRLNKNKNKIKLIIIGPQHDKIYHSKDVVYIDHVNPNEIQLYFKLSKIGVIPFKKNQLTNNSLPIKLIEYTAAKKWVLATDLNSIKELKFKNVILIPRNKKMWEYNIKKYITTGDPKIDDKQLEKFDWKKISNKIYKIILKIINDKNVSRTKRNN